MGCKVVEAVHLIGRKWTITIIEEIVNGKFEGFNDFIRSGKKHITSRELSFELKELESTGIIKKLMEKNPSSRYIATKKGEEIHKIIRKIKEWNVKWNNVDPDCLHRSCVGCPEFDKLRLTQSDSLQSPRD